MLRRRATNWPLRAFGKCQVGSAGERWERRAHLHHLGGDQTVLLQCGDVLLHGGNRREGVCSAGVQQALPPKHLRGTGLSAKVPLVSTVTYLVLLLVPALGAGHLQLLFQVTYVRHRLRSALRRL